MRKRSKSLTDCHDSTDETTEELPLPPDYAAMFVERPTIPIPYQRIPLDSLESLITKGRPHGSRR
jgi:hypothetical protein